MKMYDQKSMICRINLDLHLYIEYVRFILFTVYLIRIEFYSKSSFEIHIPKPDKDATKKRKLQANITDEHRCKNPQQNSSNQNPTTH